MSVQTAAPPCLGYFDPTATECASCSMTEECIQTQASKIQSITELKQSQKTHQAIQHDQTQDEDMLGKNNNVKSSSNGTQIIRKHQRKRLEIPPVGTTLQTFYKGHTYQAQIVADPSNSQGDGRSILFEGTVYKTLTAAAHAIAPGINSGTVWQTVK